MLGVGPMGLRRAGFGCRSIIRSSGFEVPATFAQEILGGAAAGISRTSGTSGAFTGGGSAAEESRVAAGVGVDCVVLKVLCSCGLVGMGIGGNDGVIGTTVLDRALFVGLGLLDNGNGGG